GRLEGRAVYLDAVDRGAVGRLLDPELQLTVGRIREVRDPVRTHALREGEGLGRAGGIVLGGRRPSGVGLGGAAGRQPEYRREEQEEEDRGSHAPSGTKP